MEQVRNTQPGPKPGRPMNVVERGMGNEQRQGQKQLEEPPVGYSDDEIHGKAGGEAPKVDKTKSH